MSTMVVNPPAAAADVAVAKPSHAVRPVEVRLSKSDYKSSQRKLMDKNLSWNNLQGFWAQSFLFYLNVHLVSLIVFYDPKYKEHKFSVLKVNFKQNSTKIVLNDSRLIKFPM